MDNEQNRTIPHCSFHLAEEIADVQIMLEQMELLHDCAGLVAGFKAQKLDRLEKRLRGVDGND